MDLSNLVVIQFVLYVVMIIYIYITTRSFLSCIFAIIGCLFTALGVNIVFGFLGFTLGGDSASLSTVFGCILQCTAPLLYIYKYWNRKRLREEKQQLKNERKMGKNNG